MKRSLLLIALLTFAFSACSLKSSTSVPDMQAVETLAAATQTQTVLGQPPTLMPVPTLTLIPPTSTPAATQGPDVVVTSSGPRPTRIEFAKGGVSATVVGIVTAPNRIQYVLYAFQNQQMTVQITSPNDVANFSISNANTGKLLKGLDNEAHSWVGNLPLTQDYLITVTVPDGTVNFSLTVTIVWP